MKDFAKSIRTENTKVGNGSGDWHGRIYEDRAGNSATVEKRGDGWEVYWEDSKGFGKPLGTYKDEKTARDVAEAAVETEMPDKIRGNYRSKAINQKVGNGFDTGFIRNSWDFLKTFEQKLQEYTNSKDVNGMEVLFRTVEERYKDIKREDSDAYAYSKETARVVTAYEKLANQIRAAQNKIK